MVENKIEFGGWRIDVWDFQIESKSASRMIILEQFLGKAMNSKLIRIYASSYVRVQHGKKETLRCVLNKEWVSLIN